MFTLNFSKKLMNCPVFPDDVLHPYVPTAVEPNDLSHVPSQDVQSEEELEFEPTFPAKKAKSASTSKKGKRSCRNT